MKILRLISRIIIGIVFMFSGIVKAVDPLGSTYKFQDYFHAFNLEFLQPFALILAVLLCTAEFLSGFSVLSGYRQKAGIWGVLLLMIIFTPLTLILAISNPVSDCGCFGDAIHLTNWQTFIKNVVLLVFTLILFISRKKVTTIIKPGREWSIIAVTGSLFIGFSLINLRYLPLMDFLPYKKGVNIPEQMIIPEGKPVDIYETTFIYEKDGTKREYSLENYPANDSTWTFIEQKSVLVKKGYEPPVHDFSITTREGEDITEKILGNEGFTLLMISKKLEEAESRELEKGFELGSACLSKGIDFYVVTASGTEKLMSFNNGLTFCTADETTLKTIVRANPGYLLLKKGTIAGKWSWANAPSINQLISYTSEEDGRTLNNKSPVLLVYTGALTVMVLVLLISSIITKRTLHTN